MGRFYAYLQGAEEGDINANGMENAAVYPLARRRPDRPWSRCYRPARYSSGFLNMSAAYQPSRPTNGIQRATNAGQLAKFMSGSIFANRSTTLWPVARSNPMRISK